MQASFLGPMYTIPKENHKNDKTKKKLNNICTNAYIYYITLHILDKKPTFILGLYRIIVVFRYGFEKVK